MLSPNNQVSRCSYTQLCPFSVVGGIGHEVSSIFILYNPWVFTPPFPFYVLKFIVVRVKHRHRIPLKAQSIAAYGEAYSRSTIVLSCMVFSAVEQVNSVVFYYSARVKDIFWPAIALNPAELDRTSCFPMVP
jgi:hypothetical protein